MIVFNLPDLGEGLPDAELVEWHVAEGDKVVTDQPLVSVETAKAVVEVPSPTSGRIAKLHGKPGDIVQTGEPLVSFEPDAGERPDAGTVVGEVEVGEALAREVSLPSGPGGGVKALPAVRALAARLNVDLAIVKPSGPDATITRSDVERAAAVLASAGPIQPLKGVRRTMARNMSQAHAEVAAATVCDDVCIDAWPAGTDISIRLVRAIVTACRAEPSLNAWYEHASLGRRLLERIDLGIAVDTPDGLFVPVLRDAGNRDDADLRRGLDAMKADVRARRIPPEEMRGFSFILSNFGSMAGRYAAPIVQPPSVAILGAGRIRTQVVVRQSQPAVGRVLPLSLTFDHRVVTGGEAARFLAVAMSDIEKPA